MTSSSQNNHHLKIIPWFTAGLGLCISLISLAFIRDPRFFAGILFGLILCIANFIFLTKIVVKLLDQKYKRGPFLIVLFLLKLLFMALVLGLAFAVFKVNAIAFVVGYLSLVPVVVISQFLSSGADKVSS